MPREFLITRDCCCVMARAIPEPIVVSVQDEPVGICPYCDFSDAYVALVDPGFSLDKFHPRRHPTSKGDYLVCLGMGGIGDPDPPPAPKKTRMIVFNA